MLRRTLPSAALASACMLLVTGLLTHGANKALAQAAEPAGADAARHFESQIAPLLVRRCLECHGPTSKKGRLDLSRKEAALAGGENGQAIVPGKAEDSLLWQYVESDEMPKGRVPLTAPEKRLLEQWINAGATWSVEAIGSAAVDERDIAENWLRRLTVDEYIETVRAAVGVDIERDARRLLPPDLRADGFSNTAYNLHVDLAHVEAYARLAQLIAARMDVPAFAAQYSPRRELNDDAMRELIAAMGKWVLRGPLEPRDVDAFLAVSRAVAKEGGDYDEAVRFVVEAMLQSPRFLYRVERQAGDEPRQVGGYELASRLSYILWGGPPDQELLRAAEAGELEERGQVESQVKRMLADRRAVRRSLRFIHDWMDLDRLGHLRPNADRFPHWNERLAADMRDETLAFFEEVVWKENRPLAHLLNAQVTFATPRLAEHYRLGQSRVAKGERDSASSASERVRDKLLALYAFDEARGNTVHDSSDAGEPLNLEIEKLSAAKWTPGGLTVHKPTLISAESPPQRLIEALKTSQAVTLEAWITPAAANQTGPARILTLSSGVLERNFTLGQDGDKYDVRFRGSKTDKSGIPSLTSPAGAIEQRPTHVVYTRDRRGKAMLYIDGRKRAERDVPGDLANWDNGFRLALANETSFDRPWRGTYHLVAIYCRALSADDVQQNHAAGTGHIQPATLVGVPVAGETARDLEALYEFDRGSGDAIRDTSGADPPLDLKIENMAAVDWTSSGLKVKLPTLIAAGSPPSRLIAAVKKSRALTLEAWIAPAQVDQSGPARIVSLSSGTGERNFTLGQDGDKFDVRFRTTKSDGNGLPSLVSQRGSATRTLVHVVFTREATGRARLYVNGLEQSSREMAGELSNWDSNFRLVLANETSKDRPWRGTLHRVAIFSRALPADEVLARSDLRSAAGGMARYDLGEVPGRGGLLTQGSVLTVGGDEASMVARGLFVLNELLYSGVDNPPPCVDTSPVPTKPGQSQRAIAIERIKNQACSGCHSKFEPLAFGLEKFDGLGTYHEEDEHGNTLREDGEILFPDEERPLAYKTSAELMDLLAASPRVQKAFTRKLTQFAIGRPLVPADDSLVDRIHAAAQQSGGTYQATMLAIVLSDLVQKTKARDDP